MTQRTQTHQKVAETLAYCWSHCDTDQEEETLLWIAEKLALSLGDVYRFEDHRAINSEHPRVHIIDGPNQTFGSYPLTPKAA